VAASVKARCLPAAQVRPPARCRRPATATAASWARRGGRGPCRPPLQVPAGVVARRQLRRAKQLATTHVDLRHPDAGLSVDHFQWVPDAASCCWMVTRPARPRSDQPRDLQAAAGHRGILDA
jgi:hypothetical protein